MRRVLLLKSPAGILQVLIRFLEPHPDVPSDAGQWNSRKSPHSCSEGYTKGQCQLVLQNECCAIRVSIEQAFLVAVDIPLTPTSCLGLLKRLLSGTLNIYGTNIILRMSNITVVTFKTMGRGQLWAWLLKICTYAIYVTCICYLGTMVNLFFDI